MSDIDRSGEYRFKLDAYTPETIPMARLAEYMAELAAILGETKSVHFVAIEGGSTVLAHRIEREAIPKVRDRVLAVRAGSGPRDARDAYRKVNRFLRADNARAVLQEGSERTKILEFPGIAEAEPTFPSVIHPGSIAGTVVRVGGVGESIPVLLESEGQPIAGCHTNRKVAKALAKHLFEPVRLNGQGYWMRDTAGEWVMRHFRIDGFEPLEAGSLSEALAELRPIAADWDDDVFEDLDGLRRGMVG